MSYDIDLVDEKGKLFESQETIEQGGTYVLGGTNETSLNVTYNYSWFFYHFLDKEKGIRWLYGKKAKDCIEKLEQAIEPFKNREPYAKDYWIDCPANCVQPLKTFLRWAKEFPEGVFKGD